MNQPKIDTQLIIDNALSKAITELKKRGLLDENNKLTEKEKKMLITQLKSISLNAMDICDIVEKYGHAPAWAESKISNMSSMLAQLRSYMKTKSNDLEV